jgi:hypothetical protein
MSIDQRSRRVNKIAATVVAALGLCALAAPLTPAQAQVPYLGVDLGNGVGIGIGAPPSAYGMVPASPIYPVYSPYYYPYYYGPHHYRHHRHYR